jgi:lysophospholipase L1-like esterase
MSTLFRTAALAALLLVSLGALRPFQQPVDALGDSITAPQDSYVQVAGEMLGRPVDDEAQFGWTSAQIATEYLNPTTAYVVVNAGTNDIWPIARGQATLAAREADYDALIRHVQATVPKATIVIVTVRDLGRLATPQRSPLGIAPAALSAASNAWAAHQRVVAQRIGARVLDLNAGPYYNPADFTDEVHPTEQGQARIGKALAPLLMR